MNATAKMAVGSLGTRPVARYSLTTGMPAHRPTMQNAKAISEKNLTGGSPEQRADHGDHLQTVTHRIQFRDRAFGAVAVVNRNVQDAPTMIDGVYRELGLDLEASERTGNVLINGLDMARYPVMTSE